MEEKKNFKKSKKFKKDNKDIKETCDIKVTGKSNDISWYNRNPEQLQNVANISFLTPTGTPISLSDSYATTDDDMVYQTEGASGIMRIGFVPMYGNPTTPESALNIAANKLYTEVRYKNSGHTNYDYPDLMQYFISVDGAFSWYSFLQRIYRVANLYSQENKYLPAAIFKAMGVDFDSIISNLASFRTYVNNFALKLNTLCIPNNMAIVERHFWMSQNIYLDAPGIRSQMYMFVPEVYAYYEETTASVLFRKLWKDRTQAGYSDLTFENIKTVTKQIIDAIFASEDFNIMSGDILKAYGENQLFKVAPLGADDVLIPVYDEEVLNQIMNCTALGSCHPSSGLGTTAYGIKQNTTRNNLYVIDATFNNNSPVFNPTITGVDTDSTLGTQLEKRNVLINVTTPNPTPELVMVATRLAATAKLGPTDSKVIRNELVGCGSDVVTTLDVVYSTRTSGQISYKFISQPISSVVLLYAGVNNQSNLILSFNLESTSVKDIMVHFDHFDWHPVLYIIGASIKASGQGYALQKFYMEPPFVDLFRYAIVNQRVLDNMHEVALLSMFDIGRTTRMG